MSYSQTLLLYSHLSIKIDTGFQGFCFSFYCTQWTLPLLVQCCNHFPGSIPDYHTSPDLLPIREDHVIYIHFVVPLAWGLPRDQRSGFNQVLCFCFICKPKFPHQVYDISQNCPTHLPFSSHPKIVPIFPYTLADRNKLFHLPKSKVFVLL